MAGPSPGRLWFRRLSLALTLAVTIGIVYVAYEIGALAPPAEKSTGQAEIGGPFTLIDQQGRTRRDADFRGRYMLVYFGYTYCPDVCPLDLRKMTLALDNLGPAGEAVTPIFISIDPERDTQDRLADFADALHPRLVALTGSPEQIARAAEGYRVYYSKAAGSDAEEDDYLMDHSALFYLMGPDGRYVTHIAHGATGEQMAAALSRALDS